MRGKGDGHEVRCILSIENWSRWTLGFPVVYTHYGDFQGPDSDVKISFFKIFFEIFFKNFFETFFAIL